MKIPYRELAFSVSVVLLILGVALTIEWSRRRSVRNLAAEWGGTFESGGILKGVDVPEARAFDGELKTSTVTYHNVLRVTREGARCISADYHWSSSRGKGSSSSHVVVFAVFPEAAFPEVQLSPPIPEETFKWAAKMGFSPGPRPPPLPGAIPGFDDAFVLHPLSKSKAVEPGEATRILPPAVQQELLQATNFLHGLDIRGTVVRFQARDNKIHHRYREMLTLAEHLVAIWRR